MKISIKKLDPTGVEDVIIELSNVDIQYSPSYHRFLVEIDDVKYMLTKAEAYVIDDTN